MTEITQLKEFGKAFVKAQASFEHAVMDRKNEIFGNNYADYASVKRAITAALKSNGLSYMHKSLLVPGHAAVSTVIMHKSGEMFDCGVVAVPYNVNDPVGFASAFTYAKRYSLEAAFGVSREGEDDDGVNATDKKPEPAGSNKTGSGKAAAEKGGKSVKAVASSSAATVTPVLINASQVAILRKGFEMRKKDEKTTIGWMNVGATSVEELNQTDALRCAQILKIDLDTGKAIKAEKNSEKAGGAEQTALL